jgi:uncharacterized repeat protein (TIGR01451 family)
VDNKINVTVVTTDVSPGAAVAPGQVAATPLPNPPAYVTFTVTNTGNTTQDFILSNTNPAIGTTSPFGGTSEFAVSSCRTFVESLPVADGLQIGTDSEVTYLDNIAEDATATVYLVCNTPLAAADTHDAVVGLVAEAVDAGGSVGTPSASYTVGQLTAANTQAGVEIVAADALGSEASDVARDAKHSARSAYVIASAALAVSKTVTTLCDPFNGNTSPKNIPGAIVRWTITIANTGSASATLVQVSDALDAVNTTFDNNLVTGVGTCDSATGTPENAAGRGFKLDVTGDTRPGVYPKFLTTTADADGGTHAAGTVTIDYSQGLPVEVGYTAGELKAGEAAVVYFNVTVN